MTDARQAVFGTRWFRVVAMPQSGGEPYYMLELPDYVSVIALTPARELLLVRQYRPVVQRHTLELPAGRYCCTSSSSRAGVSAMTLT